jgi:hypothetical protein
MLADLVKVLCLDLLVFLCWMKCPGVQMHLVLGVDCCKLAQDLVLLFEEHVLSLKNLIVLVLLLGHHHAHRCHVRWILRLLKLILDLLRVLLVRRILIFIHHLSVIIMRVNHLLLALLILILHERLCPTMETLRCWQSAHDEVLVLLNASEVHLEFLIVLLLIILMVNWDHVII